ncbi:hypothetical protein ACWV26_02170 [Rummeliibacillus sp. JY-2-4R]
MMSENVYSVMQYLPINAKLLVLPNKGPAILLADLDGDWINELIIAYHYQNENYLMILKWSHGNWIPILNSKGAGYGITDLQAVPLTRPGVNTLIVGWRIGSIWSKLDLLQWMNHQFVHLPTNNIVYSKLEVEDMPGKYGRDGQFEMAVWVHDTGEAYKVQVYRLNGLVWSVAKDAYPYYFKKVAAFYKKQLQKDDYSFYWYYLADAQMKAGELDQALQSINRALTFPDPYPSKEKMLELKNEIIQRLYSNLSSAAQKRSQHR